MDTLNLTTPVATHVSTSVVTRPFALNSTDDARAEPIARTSVNGLEWTCRNGFSRVVAGVDARAWTAPGDAGWMRVKHNGSRDVWRTSLDGRTYYVKYFFSDGWAAAAKLLLRGPACLT